MRGMTLEGLWVWALALLAAALLVACAESGGPGPEAPPAGPPPRLYPAWPWADRAIAWMDWGPEAFAAARSRGRHVLLYVAAPGCEGAFSRDEAVIQSLVEERFVPVRVDPFRRPDVARQYAPAGWPAVVVLDSLGRTVAAAVDLAPDRTRLFLARMHHHLEARPDVVADRVRAATSAAAWTAAEAAAAIAGAFDGAHGGFGRGIKAPEWPVLLFLLDWHEVRGDPAALDMVEQTLARVLSEPMWDGGAGGVWVYSYTPDWRVPHWEKDAADQGGMLLVLSRLPELDGEQLGVMGRLIEYVEGELLDPADGLLRGRQVRRAAGDWWTDPAAYADRHALLARGLLAASQRLEGEAAAGARGAAAGARRLGLAAVDALEARAVDQQGRVAHWVEGGQPGLVSSLLEDQILVAGALLAAADLSGEERYRERALQVLGYAERHLWDAERGAFRPGPGPGVEGLVWSEGRHALDGALPAGNALAAMVYLALGDGERSGRLLAGACPAGPPGRAHATWARALLAHAQTEIEVR